MWSMLILKQILTHYNTLKDEQYELDLSSFWFNCCFFIGVIAYRIFPIQERIETRN